MKPLLITTLAALCLSAALPQLAHSAETSACDPRITKAPVRVPRRALELNQTGVVIVQAQIDATGRADSVATVVSSGKTRLDSAAERAVRKRWQFDVSQCAASDLPAVKFVAVEFASAASKVAASSDECFRSSRASAYGHQRTVACLTPSASATLARANAK